MCTQIGLQADVKTKEVNFQVQYIRMLPRQNEHLATSPRLDPDLIFIYINQSHVSAIKCIMSCVVLYCTVLRIQIS